MYCLLYTAAHLRMTGPSRRPCFPALCSPDDPCHVFHANQMGLPNQQPTAHRLPRSPSSLPYRHINTAVRRAYHLPSFDGPLGHGLSEEDTFIAHCIIQSLALFPVWRGPTIIFAQFWVYSLANCTIV